MLIHRRHHHPPHLALSDATGKRGAPLSLLILGALRYLGRGWTFADLEENTAISIETHRTFFHEFVAVRCPSPFLADPPAAATADRQARPATITGALA